MKKPYRLGAFVVAGLSLVGCVDQGLDQGPETSEVEGAVRRKRCAEDAQRAMSNNQPIANAFGFAATYASAGYVDLDNAFFTPQGTNGRHCGTCHAPEVGWSMTGERVTQLFEATDGLHPIFANHLDTDTPTADMSTTEARWDATTMLRQGKFTRKIALPATRDYDLVDIDDPFGVSTATTLFFFRRPMPTANLRTFNVHWDNALTVGTDLREGLVKQARANITAAQQGSPAPDSVVFEIVDYERQLAHAQVYLWGVGSLTDDGARGGPAFAAAQPLVSGRFDLFDSWRHSSNEKRRQIWRGQEVFNNVNAPSGRRCGGCHNAANNGGNVGGGLFDIGASSPDVASSDMAVFTFKSRTDGQVIQSTDPGAGLRTGNFRDLNKFKVPNLRGVASRAPYFHGGTAETLEKVVDHYKDALGFQFTSDERDALVAFLRAL
jgi:mono/diheme cytochrome c family protein